MMKAERKIDFSNMKYNGVHIDWKNSIGGTIPFIYGDINGELKLINKEKEIITIEYNNKQYRISSGTLRQCKLKKVVNDYKDVVNWKYNVSDNIKDNKRDFTILDRETRQRKTKTKVVQV